MRRLKAILAPVSPSGRRSRLVVTGVGVLIAGVAGAGSLAVAAQREPVVVARLAPAPATLPIPLAAPAPSIPARIVEPVAPAPPAPARRETLPEQPALPTQTVEASTEVITNPIWVQPPIPRAPAGPVPDGVTEGRVRVTCTAEADGRLSDCSVVSETPSGAGFGAAAIEAAASARISPGMIDPAAVRPKVTFGILFRLPT